MICLVAIGWKEGEARMCQVHPVIARGEAELRRVWSAVWVSASDDEREGRSRMGVGDRNDGYWVASVAMRGLALEEG